MKSPAFDPGHKFLAADPFGPRINRLALVTDAWKPQTNGVVNTLVRLVKHLELEGMEVLVVAPDAHRTLPLPSYPEIRVACDPWKAIGRASAASRPTPSTSPPRGRSASGRSAGCATRSCASRPASTPATPST